MNSIEKDTPVLLILVAILGPIVWLYENVWSKQKAGAPLPVAVHHAVSAPWWQTAQAFGWQVLMVVLGLLLLYAIANVVMRLYWRNRRGKEVEVCEILLGPDDVAAPFEVMSAIDAIHMMLFQRYGRSAVGQGYWTFEIVRDDQGQVHFLISTQHAWMPGLQNMIRSKYTNVRYESWSGEEHILRWAQEITLEKHWSIATETVRDYTNSVVETVVQAMDSLDCPAHFQIHMRPLPIHTYHQAIQQKIRRNQYDLRQQQTEDPAQAGVGYVEDKSLKNSIQLMGRSVFAVEIRLAADTWTGVQAIYGALAEANDENRLKASTVVVGKGLWFRWLFARMPAFMLFKHSVMFSFPLATIIHLPSNRLRVNSLRRSLVRRSPAIMAIPRTQNSRDGMMQDADSGDYLRIPEEDREANMVILGSQGSGKTTDLLNMFRIDAGYLTRDGKPKCVILMDAGKDTARRGLGMVDPAKRDVIFFAPGDPNCPYTFNPLLSSLPPSVVTDSILEAMTQVFGADAIRERSREYLANSILAVMDAMQKDADFISVYRMLADAEARADIAERVQDPHQRMYWRETFPQALAADPRFVMDALSAPRNKLDEILRNERTAGVLSATGSTRTLIDLREVVRGRKILIVNLDKSKLGDAGARLIGVFLIRSLWDALQSENDMEERDRVPVSLLLDESQNYISDGFLDLLSEGRAYGLHTTIALRFLGEIRSELVTQGLHTLVQNIVIHQFQLLAEAQEFMTKFMRTYANMVQVTAESQDALNFGADDIMRLPKFMTICQWSVHNSIQQAFLGRTINWEPFYREDWKQAHLARVPKMIAQIPESQDSTEDRGAGGVASQAKPEAKPEAAPVARTRQAKKESKPQQSDAQQTVTDAVGEAPEVLQETLIGQIDPMTGLFSNAELLRQLNERRTNCGGEAVVFMDLDGLKEINDTQGHSAGDDLICRGALALKGVLREGDVPTHKSGDEFVAILHDIDEKGLEAFKERLREALWKSGISASIGGALRVGDEHMSAVVDRADKAMYRDKAQRKAGRETGGLSDDLAVLVQRLAVLRNISNGVILKAIREAGASEADIKSTLLYLINKPYSREQAIRMLKKMLGEKQLFKDTVDLKRKITKLLGLTEVELERLLLQYEISNEDFVSLARRFLAGGFKTKAELVDFMRSKEEAKVIEGGISR